MTGLFLFEAGEAAEAGVGSVSRIEPVPEVRAVSDMIQRHVRWGILGTATIARKNWRAMRDSGVAVVGAVASRDAAKSRAFVEACQSEVPFETRPLALGSYGELIASRDIDAVYVPLPTALRKEWVMRAADAGKHVVCEKPCAPSATDLRDMLTACRRNGVQFMDGVMFSHSRRLAAVRDRLATGTVGVIRRIASGFSFRAGEDFEAGNIRADAALEPAGCLGDLGWYCIRFVLEAMPDRMPRSVTGRILSEMRAPGASGAVPAEFSGELLYDGGVSLGFYCSFLTENQQWVSVQGSEGRLTVDDFVLPYAGDRLSYAVSKPEYHIRGCDFRMESHGEEVWVVESAHGTPNAQESNLYRAVSTRILEGRREPWWVEVAWRNQVLIDACLASARAGGREVSVPVESWS